MHARKCIYITTRTTSYPDPASHDKPPPTENHTICTAQHLPSSDRFDPIDGRDGRSAIATAADYHGTGVRARRKRGVPDHTPRALTSADFLA